MRVFLSGLFTVIIIVSCSSGPTIKPAAQLRLEYPTAQYEPFNKSAYFSFQKNTMAQYKAASSKRHKAININYPKLKATVYLTYKPVEDNLTGLLRDAQKLTYDHAPMADAIVEQPFENPRTNVYGMFYSIEGNAATSCQFYVTDSLSHFLLGAVYFNVKPNYDSLFPAITYIRRDVRHIMESLQWK